MGQQVEHSRRGPAEPGRIRGRPSLVVDARAGHDAGSIGRSPAPGSAGGAPDHGSFAGQSCQAVHSGGHGRGDGVVAADARPQVRGARPSVSQEASLVGQNACRRTTGRPERPACGRRGSGPRIPRLVVLPADRSRLLRDAAFRLAGPGREPVRGQRDRLGDCGRAGSRASMSPMRRRCSRCSSRTRAGCRRAKRATRWSWTFRCASSRTSTGQRRQSHAGGNRNGSRPLSPRRRVWYNPVLPRQDPLNVGA